MRATHEHFILRKCLLVHTIRAALRALRSAARLREQFPQLSCTAAAACQTAPLISLGSFQVLSGQNHLGQWQEKCTIRQPEAL